MIGRFAVLAVLAAVFAHAANDIKILPNNSVVVNGSVSLGATLVPWTSADVAYAKQYLYLSYSSYCPTTQIEAWDCTFCEYIKRPSAATVMVQYNLTYELRSYVTIATVSRTVNAAALPTVIIAFRGSSNIPNWIQDFKFDKKSINGSIEVHEGFLESYKSLHKEVITAAAKSCQQLAKLTGVTGERPVCPIAVTGHSLGAAIAVLAVSDIAGGWSGAWTNLTFTPQLVAHVDFGCPRVGNKAFSQWFSQVTPVKQIRMVNYQDIVPHLPPTYFDFEHTLQETWELKNGTSYVFCSATNPEDPLCSDSVPLIDYNPNDHTDYMQTEETC